MTIAKKVSKSISYSYRYENVKINLAMHMGSLCRVIALLEYISVCFTVVATS